MCVANSKRLSRRMMAMSLLLLDGLYEGCTSIDLAPTSWKGSGSLVLPSSHSPALMRTSLTGTLRDGEGMDKLLLGQDPIHCTYPCTQLAEVNTNSSPMMAPPQSSDLVDSRSTIACHGISAKLASISFTPVGLVLLGTEKGREDY